MAARYATDTFVVSFLLANPSGLTATAVASGGSFAAATYHWMVTFTNGNGETAGSNEASATIVANGSATLAWTAPSAGTSHVKVYRGTSAGGENTLVATLAGNAASYTDTGSAGTAGSPPASSTAAIASELIEEGSLHDSTSAAVTAVPGKFTTSPPVAGQGHVTGVLAGRLAAYPAGTEVS